jgi:transcriptional regulator with XRE-family HTH domain
MADLLGVDRKTIGRWESGETSPEAAQLQGLALAGWDVLYILTGERMGGQSGASVESVIKGEMSAEEQLMLACWRNLTPELRQAVSVIMGSLCP